jgi:enamine deaminase RidA (YjgF/YER057c/UK114 family)
VIEERLAERGIELPEPSAPGANYVPFVRVGRLLFVTGQLSQWNGQRRFIGKLASSASRRDSRPQDCVR